MEIEIWLALLDRAKPYEKIRLALAGTIGLFIHTFFNFVVPPSITEEMLKQCPELGLKRIWLQPGSESETALTYCQENNLKVVHGVCVMLSRKKLNNDRVVILKRDESLKNRKLEE